MNKGLYEQLITNLEKLRISHKLLKVEGGDNFRILKPEKISPIKVRPKKNTFYLTALLFGLAIGGGLVVLAELVDHSVTSIKDAKSVLPLSVLGFIPEIHIDKKRKQNNVSAP